MPIYDYTCKGCEQEFEVVVYNSDLIVCPICESLDVEKKFIFNGSIVFEGTGWTPTHYNKPLQKHTRYR